MRELISAPARGREAKGSMPEREPWQDIATAAAHLGVKVSWLYSNGDRAGVPVARVGRARRYLLSELDRWALGQAFA